MGPVLPKRFVESYDISFVMLLYHIKFNPEGELIFLTGFTKKGFIIRNSWGTKWGYSGYTYYPFEEFGMHWEIWTTIDGKSPVLDQKTGFARIFEYLRKMFSICRNAN